MLDTLITTMGKGILVMGLTIANWFGIVPSDYFVPVVKEVETKVIHEYEPAPILGGSFVTPDVKALFTTSLASKITSSDTSMTLVSATDKDGTSLASSTYGFIIDEGTSVEEFVLADCTGTTCTNMTRGISVSTATTSVASLKFEHRRGASVKITTAPSLVFVMNALKGKQNLENVIRYDSSVSTTTVDDFGGNLVNVDLLNYTAFNGAGVVDGTTSIKGVVELASTLEGASSTPTGGSGNLVLPASSATSTYNSATAPLRVVVTQNSGKIDNNFISTSTGLFTNVVLVGTTTLATSSSLFTTGIKLVDIGKNIKVITTTGTSTFSVPSGVNKLKVEVVGGGGRGGDGAGSNGGGGAGGYSMEFVDVSGTSTIQVYVGVGGDNSNANGQWTTFGTNGSFLYAIGGLGASNAGNLDNTRGGIAGCGVGGDLNICGGDGNAGVTNGSTDYAGGTGGSSFMGGGGFGGVNSSNGGNTGYAYGSGGGGSVNAVGAGSGAQGVIIITW